MHQAFCRRLISLNFPCLNRLLSADSLNGPQGTVFCRVFFQFSSGGEFI